MKIDYKKELLKLISEKELNIWLEKNPMPDEWEDRDRYSWAYTEMPIGTYQTWYRKNVLGWDI